jgi:hypothetical protein
MHNPNPDFDTLDHAIFWTIIVVGIASGISLLWIVTLAIGAVL